MTPTARSTTSPRVQPRGLVDDETENLSDLVAVESLQPGLAEVLADVLRQVPGCGPQHGCRSRPADRPERDVHEPRPRPTRS